jgi:hypothetical protein
MYSLYIVYYDMGTPCCPPHGAGQQCAQPYMPDRLRKITWFEPIVRPSTWTGDMAYGLHIRPLTCYTMGSALSGETVDSSDTGFQSSSSTPKINQFLKAIQHPPPPPPPELVDQPHPPDPPQFHPPESFHGRRSMSADQFRYC